MIINLINRSFPPIQGITGASAHELATALLKTSNRLQVNAISVNANYGNNSLETKNESIKNYTINTFYNGKNNLIRLFSNIYEGIKLVALSNKLNPDVVICMTEPPLLNIVGALFLKRNTKFILWSMDLYPETLSASGLLGSKNIIYKLLDKFTIRHKPDILIALGSFQANYLHKKYMLQMPTFILPCGIFENKNIITTKPAWANTNKIIIGYCGNLGAAHSLELIIEMANLIDYDKYQFVISVYGSKSKELLSNLSNNSKIVFVESVSRAELSFIDIHIASLLEKWVNVCVPSKTVSSVCANSTFVYYGIENSDNWHLLSEAGWIIDIGEKASLKTKVQFFLNSVSKEKIILKKESAREIHKKLLTEKEKTFQEIAQYFQEISN